MLIGKKLDIIHFGIFDYVAYKHVLEEKHQKWIFTLLIQSI